MTTTDHFYLNIKLYVKTRDRSLLPELHLMAGELTDIEILGVIDHIEIPDEFFHVATTLFTHFMNIHRCDKFFANRSVASAFATICVIRGLGSYDMKISAIAKLGGPKFVRCLMEVPSVHRAFDLGDIFLSDIARSFYFRETGTVNGVYFSRACMRSVVRAGNNSIFKYAIQRGYEPRSDTLKDLFLLDNESEVPFNVIESKDIMLQSLPVDVATHDEKMFIYDQLCSKKQKMYLSMFTRKFPEFPRIRVRKNKTWFTRCLDRRYVIPH